MASHYHPDVLLPFIESRQTRHAYLSRTQSLLSAALKSSDDEDAAITILTLPNNIIGKTNEGGDEERRPTSTYIIRPPSPKELAVLLDPQQCNCRLLSSTSKSSSNVKLMYRAAGNGEAPSMVQWDVSSSLKEQVYNCCFGGHVIIGVLLDGPDSAVVTTAKSNSNRSITKLIGISNNGLIQDSILEPGCSIHNNSEVSNTHVMKYAAIIGCGSITCCEESVTKARKKCAFDMYHGTMDIEVGPEAGGGRVVTANVESTLVDVCHALNMDLNNNGGTTTSCAPLVQFDTRSGAEEAAEGGGVRMNVLCPHSSVLHTPQTNHVQLMPHSSIDSATSVTSALLLPKSTIKNGCTVSHALLQWDATLTSHSDAHHVFLMERSEVGPHSFTANTIYGPDSHVSGGEVHCTIFGPNANSHHQSLLIGILWPLGRGNVGYGSNVGSNHTGRIPDQETSVGEGTFWGLGCVIKFPVDLTSSPYSIIAAGVQLPPQRIHLPFSLITDGPGGMNQITPGWLLHYSPYTIARSEVKFANRRTAKRHDFYTGWKILRAGVMDLLIDARDALLFPKVALESSTKVFKGDKAIVGLGANQLTEKGRQIGIRAYTDALQRYALRGLLQRLVDLCNNRKGVTLVEALHHVGLDGVVVKTSHAEGGVVAPPSKSVVNWPVLPWNEASHTDPEALWKHQHSILMKELPSIVRNGNGNDTLSQLLQKCIVLENDHASRVYKSKSRDDVRGAATVPGYRDVHIAAEKDSVVLAAKEEADMVKKEVQLVEEALGGTSLRSRL
jgi:NDP-sugar pyrophosphorylase family protein